MLDYVAKEFAHSDFIGSIKSGHSSAIFSFIYPKSEGLIENIAYISEWELNYGLDMVWCFSADSIYLAEIGASVPLGL